jgi:hypothetical protein
MGDLPAHEEHQEEPKQQKEKGGDAVLNADDLMVGGENVFAPEPQILVVGFVGFVVCGWLHFCIDLLLPVQLLLTCRCQARQ